MPKGIEDVIAGHRDAVTVKRVFGEPYEKNGVTVIPAAKVFGGGGGGGTGDSETQGGIVGSGSGFGLLARPVGVYIVRGDEVSWQPAVDVNRLVASVVGLAAVALIFRRRRRRPKR